MIVNRVIGLTILLIYTYLLLNRGEYFPFLVEIERGKHMSGDAIQGYDFIVMLPFVGVACLILPETFTELFSPKYAPWNRDLLTPGFFVLVGYFCLLVSIGLLWVIAWNRPY